MIIITDVTENARPKISREESSGLYLHAVLGSHEML